MEKRITSKTRIYVQNLKEQLKNKIVADGKMDNGYMNELVQYIYDYPQLVFLPQDFQKRKRVKNIVPFFERCCALRANGEQCTRRKKNHPKFCGTHVKGTPHGEITQSETPKTHTKKTCWAQEIKGIIYYIDDGGNVYDTDDILGEAINPRVIAKYEKKDDNYNIPAFFK
uniref:Uncharacterized protein n=1 Tax=viral metagenome TaxID=1070528 RepID=A0A6C0KDH4_9ZZZZ|tara:strand:- start:6 stop:515 length:510 start_codon:yes stop_codon:yes gene_type:complete